MMQQRKHELLVELRALDIAISNLQATAEEEEAIPNLQAAAKEVPQEEAAFNLQATSEEKVPEEGMLEDRGISNLQATAEEGGPEERGVSNLPATAQQRGAGGAGGDADVAAMVWTASLPESPPCAVLARDVEGLGNGEGGCVVTPAQGLSPQRLAAGNGVGVLGQLKRRPQQLEPPLPPLQQRHKARQDEADGDVEGGETHKQWHWGLGQPEEGQLQQQGQQVEQQQQGQLQEPRDTAGGEDVDTSAPDDALPGQEAAGRGPGCDTGVDMVVRGERMPKRGAGAGVGAAGT